MQPDLLDLARQALETFARQDGCERSEQSEESRPPVPVSSLLSLNSHQGLASRRRCWTCGEPATGRYDDGSPRWNHGHDSATGLRWSAPPRSFRFGPVRVCPGCASGHAVGTTCGGRSPGEISDRSEESPDLVASARRVFGDDLAGGALDREGGAQTEAGL